MPQVGQAKNGAPKLVNRGPAGLLNKLPPRPEGAKVPSQLEVASVKDQIIESLLPLVESIEPLVFDPMNARLHPERNMEAIVRSLCLYGQRTPLVVNRRGNIVLKGNGTLTAMRRLGWTKAAVAWVDDDEVTAACYGLADNRTAELATWDQENVAKIDKIRAEAEHPSVGWSDDELYTMAWDINEVDSNILNQTTDITNIWSIMIVCESEQQQTELLERLTGEGLTCRALMS